MGPPMIFHVALLHKGFATQVTAKGFEAVVDADVRVIFVLVLEVLATQLAAVPYFLILCTMHLHVLPQVAWYVKELAAQTALKFLLI